MRPKTITLTGNGSSTSNSTPIPVDRFTHDTSLFLVTDGTTTGFTVQYTWTTPRDYASAVAWNAATVWSNHETLVSMLANGDGNFDFPVLGIRLQADGNGTDTGSLTIIQGA